MKRSLLNSAASTPMLALAAITMCAQANAFPTVSTSYPTSLCTPSISSSDPNYQPVCQLGQELILPEHLESDGNPNLASIIPPSQLASGYLSPYFFRNAAGELVFTAPANGATTSPGTGSDHTRSELREMYNTPDYAWTSATGGELRADVSVDSVAPRASIAVFGQLHGNFNPLVVLGWRPYSNPLPSITASVFLSPTSTTPTTYVLLRNIAQGDPIRYSLRYDSSNQVSISVSSGNQSTTRTIPLDPGWATAPVYFSAGAYHVVDNLNNTPTDQTRIRFRSLDITH